MSRPAWKAFVVCGVWLALGCGETASSSGGAAGSAGQAAGGASSNGGQAGQATAGTTAAGSAAGGTSSNGGHAGVATGGAATAGTSSSAGAGASSGGSSAGAAGGLADCDPKKVLCKISRPECPQGQVPSVVESCYGDCVKIDRCSCTSADQCPEPEQYTCLKGPMHCSYFLK